MGSLGAGREAEPRAGAEKGPTRYEPKGPLSAVSVWKVKPVLLGTDPPQTGAPRRAAGRGWSISVPARLARCRPRAGEGGGSEKVLEREPCISEGAAQGLHPWPRGPAALPRRDRAWES